MKFPVLATFNDRKMSTVWKSLRFAPYQLSYFTGNDPFSTMSIKSACLAKESCKSHVGTFHWGKKITLSKSAHLRKNRTLASATPRLDDRIKWYDSMKVASHRSNQWIHQWVYWNRPSSFEVKPNYNVRTSTKRFRLFWTFVHLTIESVIATWTCLQWLSGPVVAVWLVQVYLFLRHDIHLCDGLWLSTTRRVVSFQLYRFDVRIVLFPDQLAWCSTSSMGCRMYNQYVPLNWSTFDYSFACRLLLTSQQ